MPSFYRAPAELSPTKLAGKNMHLWKAHHFSMRLPCIHCTISDLSHTISCDGSYPLVVFPTPLDRQHSVPKRSHVM